MTLLSLAITPDMLLSLPKVASLLLGLAFFFMVVDLCETRRGIEVSLGGLVAAGAVIGVVGLLGTRWLEKSGLLSAITARLPQLINGLPGAVEGFHPNQVAGTMLWVIPVALTLGAGLWQRPDRRRWSVVAALAGAWMAGVLVLTQSRSGWFGMALALLGMLAAVNRRARWGLATVGVALIAVVVLTGLDPVRPGGGDAALVGDTVGALNWDFRLEIWRVALLGIADFPFTGMGIGVFREVSWLLYAPQINPGFDIAHAHNEFLQIALDLGLLGLIAFVALYVAAFRMLRRMWRMASDPLHKTSGFPVSTSTLRLLVLGLSGGLFAHLMYSLTDAVALGAKPGVLFWVLLGLVAGLFERLQAARSGATR
ncbi:MAG TPA: O-antigen ligase family protein [Anaerolineae bacterium]|nr:O-antigen ligase family protein [Anaerolineae bacterium]